VEITSSSTTQSNGKWITQVAVRQGGTAKPFRLRFSIKVAGQSMPVQMSTERATFKFTTDNEPEELAIDPFATALIHVGSAVSTNRR
jgi:hypothetical protein